MATSSHSWGSRRLLDFTNSQSEAPEGYWRLSLAHFRHLFFWIQGSRTLRRLGGLSASGIFMSCGLCKLLLVFCNTEGKVDDVTARPVNSRIGIILACGLVCALASCTARKGYEDALLRGREDALRTNLSIIRREIKQYISDNGRPPQALSDLVSARQINQIPSDPITDKADWVIVPHDCPPSAKCQQGIKDVHSASTSRSTNGSLYSDW